MTDHSVELDNASIAELLELGGAELLQDLVTDFRAFADQAARAMQLGAASGDCPAIAEAAHSIKSSSASLGATELNAGLREIESLAREGNLAEIQARLPALERTRTATETALVARAGL